MRYVLTALLMVIFTSGVALAEDERVITVTGIGSVETVPDMATLRLGVTHEAKRATDAIAATTEGVAAVLSRLEEAGIEARDMQTDQLSLQPVWSDYDANTRRITGFVASNILIVRVRDLDGLGQVLDLVISDGANSFNGLSFGLQEPKPAQDAARTAAVADAVDRAEQLAAAAGVTLGPIQSISEQGGVARPQMMEMALSRAAADVPIAQGEVSTSAQVNIVFAIAE
ncbi:SIMPL domain-containing protein [Roseobacter sinensis]|uniref:SIMPL domain-containing protein n=1 Tax=Roseobacter sinensis TaxID=2931391 RepID=A0ABT3BGE7_9RHOB|nr:SIMPL domain-containing protein [Roseobacter sp. WL0113]MCV3272652.1 SIMPL domain-containing protein [Roseobacter sp. WL0113]